MKITTRRLHDTPPGQVRMRNVLRWCHERYSRNYRHCARRMQSSRRRSECLLCIRKDLVSCDEASLLPMELPNPTTYLLSWHSLVNTEDASKKIGKLSKEIGAREAQLRSEAMVTEEYERRIWEMEALVNDAKEREELIHSG